MADFVESAKNFVSSAVSRTGWEAQKQMRVRSKQHEIDDLLDQREQLLNNMVKAAIELYQQGMLADPQISRICASIIELEADVENRKTQMQEVKKEVYPASQLGPSPTADYTPPTQTAPPPVPPVKGKAKAKYQSPAPVAPTAAPPAPAPAPQSRPQQPATNAGALQLCPTCGNAVRPNALYCRSCGTKLR